MFIGKELNTQKETRQSAKYEKIEKMKAILLFLSLAFCMNASAQKINLLTLNQLNDRLDLGRDTTFIINFWATWCVPCTKELPAFESISDEYKNEKLRVLLVSMDFKSKLNTSVLPFIKRNGIKGEVFLLDEPDPQIFINRIDSSWSGALPATLIVKSKKHEFFEREFTKSELLSEYKNFQ